MPEMKDLMPIVLSLVLVGMLIGVGVIIQSKTYVAFADEEPWNESGVSLINGTNVELEKDWVTEIVSIENNQTRADGASVDKSNFTTFGVSSSPDKDAYVQLLETSTELIYDSNYGVTSDIEYTYRNVAGSDASSATSSMLSATKDIATSWMSLIITVIVLSIILGLVIGSFGMGTGRK